MNKATWNQGRGQGKTWHPPRPPTDARMEIIIRPKKGPAPAAPGGGIGGPVQELETKIQRVRTLQGGRGDALEAKGSHHKFRGEKYPGRVKKGNGRKELQDLPRPKNRQAEIRAGDLGYLNVQEPLLLRVSQEVVENLLLYDANIMEGHGLQ
eukprot:UN4288